MRIHGICLVKNEGDIMRYFLRDSARWCDRIYVFDNGSTDHTWAIARELAGAMPQVALYKQDGRTFDDALRAEVFRHYKAQAQPGDWWCRLDADEIYIDNPREFLAQIPAQFHVVWSQHLQYFLTTADLPRFTPQDETEAPEINETNLPRYYLANASESRFFRHRAGLEWPGGAWPHHLGLVAPQRIRLKHLQYRSPAQVQRRLDTRRAAAAGGWQHFQHSLEKTWREKVADPAGLSLDRGDGQYDIDPAKLPRHLEPTWRRGLKRIMHGLHLWP
jgi:hypothetical protein